MTIDPKKLIEVVIENPSDEYVEYSIRVGEYSNRSGVVEPHTKLTQVGELACKSASIGCSTLLLIVLIVSIAIAVIT